MKPIYNRGRNRDEVVWGCDDGEQVAVLTRRGLRTYPQFASFKEDWLKAPGIAADTATFTASVANTELAIALQANPHWIISGTNCVSSCSTFPTTKRGVVLTTTTADGDQVLCGPNTNTKQSALAVGWLSQDRLRFFTWLKTGASIAKTIIIAGLKKTSTPVTATDDDQIHFRYTSTVVTSGETILNWSLVISRAGVDMVIDTGIPVVVSSLYGLEIFLDQNLIPSAMIYVVETTSSNTVVRRKNVALTDAQKAALTSAITLYPFIGVMANGATPGAKAITLLPGTEISSFMAA